MNGKFLRVLRDMYAKAKSCVKTRHGLCSFFVSNVGLCQGKMLSSVLFSLFLNDLKGFLTSFFKNLFLLLYADDTVVLAECREDLQRALDMLRIYCEVWGLDINVRKTKVMIFSRRKIKIQF